MKTLKLFLIAVGFIFMHSCKEKSGEIQVQNNISNVKIKDVKWGYNFIERDLIPGESSRKLTIEETDEDFPSSYKVSFIMSANNKEIYLETEESYLLDDGDYLFIILTDETRVKNPND